MYPQVDDIMVALYAGPNKESFDWALSVKMKWGGYAAFRVDDGTEGFCWSDRSGRENIKVVTSSRLAAFVKIGKSFKTCLSLFPEKIPNQDPWLYQEREWTVWPIYSMMFLQ